MRKSVFGLCCLAACGAAQAQSKVEVYGIVTGGLSYIDKIGNSSRGTASRVGLDSGQYTQSRLGFRGTEDLGGGLKADFVIEGGMTIDNGASGQGGATFGRRTTIGLIGAFGDLQLGRRKDYTDFIARKYASTTRMLVFTGKAHANNLDRSTGERANNMVYYTTPTVGGFQGNLTYAFGERAGDHSAGQSLGVGGNYDNGPLGVGFAYWQSKKGATVGSANSSSDQGASSNAGCNTAALGNAGDICTKAWILGSSYRLNDLTLRGTYSLVKQPLINAASGTAPNFAANYTAAPGVAAFAAGGINNSKAGIVDVGADYRSGSWLFKGSVIHSRYDFVGAATDGKLTALLFGLDYSLSKRSLVYAMIGTMHVDDMYSPGLTSNGAPGIDNAQNAMTLGILHRF